MKKIISIVITFILIINLAACKNNKDISKDTNSLKYNTLSDDTFKMLKENIYDISDVFKLPSTISIDKIDFTYNYVLGYDFEKNEYICIPFSSDKLKPDITRAIYIPESKGQSGQTVKFNISKNYIIFIKGRAWEPTKTITIYSLKDGSIINEWKIEQSTQVQINNEKILLIYTNNNTQSIEYIDPNSLEKKEILKWDITKKTQSPILDCVVIGDEGFAFTGTIYPNDSSQSTTCFGMIKNNKSTVYLERKENFRSLEYNNGIMIFDNEPVYGSYSPELGHFELYDVKSMKKLIVTPETKNETYSRVYISKSGRYLVTGGLLSNEKCIRLYDTLKNELKAKFSFETTVKNPTMEIISISEDQNIILIVIKGTDTTKIYLLKY